MPPSIVLSRPSPCNVPQGYASVAELPAALLGCHFEHPAEIVLYRATDSISAVCVGGIIAFTLGFGQWSHAAPIPVSLGICL